MTTAAKILRAMPNTIAGLSATTGYSITTIRLRMILLREHDDAHIGEWRSNHSQRIAVYHAGPGDDAPRLPARTNTENSRIHRQRLANPDFQAVQGRRA